MFDDELVSEKEDTELVRHLQDISRASFADEESLSRIRERLLKHRVTDVNISTLPKTASRENAVLAFPARQQEERKGWDRRLSVLAALLTVIVLVGSLVSTVSFIHKAHTNSHPVVVPTGRNTPVPTSSIDNSPFFPSSHLPVPYGSIFLANSQTAWVQTITSLPGEGDVAGPLVRTTDGGSTWQDITPPQSNFDVADQFYPIDATTAWLVEMNFTAAPNIIGNSILRTVDGGASWQTFALPATSGQILYSSMSFLSRDLGWITQLKRENGKSVSVSYLTTDGAQTWRQLANLSLGSIPENVVPEITMQFVDNQSAWVSVVSPTGSNVYTTHDGGNSWHELALPESLKAPSLWTAHVQISLRFFNAHDGYLMAQTGTTQSTGITLYPTHDGGQTWQSSSMINVKGGYLTEPLHFLSEQQVQLLTPSGVHIYTLAQGNWTITSSHPTMRGTLLFDSFVDASNGLAVADYTPHQDQYLGSISDDDLRLLKTTDGGASWMTVKYLPAHSKLTPATMGYLTTAGWTYFTAHEGFGPENFSTSLQTGAGNAAPAILPHLVVRKWMVRFMCVGDHSVSMELNGTQHFSVSNCDQKPTSTVVTFAIPQVVSTLNVHASKHGHWLAVFFACTNEKLCQDPPLS